MLRPLVIIFLGFLLSAGKIPDPSKKRPKRVALFLIVDVSGSMYGRPLEIVKNTIGKAFENFPKHGAAGLMSFSGCGRETIKLHVPLGKGNGPEVVRQSVNLRADGYTDIHLALQMAKTEIEKLGSTYCSKVILLTDGMDTCGGSNVEILNYTKTILETNKSCNSFSAVSLGYVEDVDKNLFDEMMIAGNREDEQREHSNVEVEDVEDVIMQEIQVLLEKEVEIEIAFGGDYKGLSTGGDNSKTTSTQTPIYNKKKEKEEKKELNVKQEKEKPKSRGAK